MPKPNRKFPFILNYSTMLLLVLVFVITRCKKEPDMVQDDKSVFIQFSRSTISYNDVDSAIVLLAKGNDSVKKIMTKESGGLKADLNDLANGEWVARIFLYARVQQDNHSRRYDLVQNIRIAENEKGTRLFAATGLFDDQWKPRIIIANGDRSVLLTVALDPNDPYTDLEVNDPAWDYSYTDRTALYKNANGEQRTDGGSWECDGDCFVDGSFYFERNAFAGFSQRMANRNWLRSEVYCLMMNRSTGEELNLYHANGR